MTAGPIEIAIAVNDRGVQAGLNRVSSQLRTLDASAAKSAASMSRIDSAFEKLSRGGAIAAGAGAVAYAINDVVQAASRWEQAQGALTSVFKGQAPAMVEHAKAAQNIGLSMADYGQAAAKLGAQLKNLGIPQEQVAQQTDGLITLAADFAAAMGGTAAEAVDAFSAALRGENDPIERYGITLRETAIQSEMAARGISRAQAVISIAMTQGKDFIGQAAREYDSFASAQQRAAAALENSKTSLGQALLPIGTKLADGLTTIANLFNSIPAGVRDFATSMLAAAVAVKAVQLATRSGAAGLTRWAENSDMLANAWRTNPALAGKAVDGIQRTTSAMSKAANALPVVGAAVITLAEGFSFLSDKAKEGAVSLETLQQELASGGFKADTLGQLNAQVREGLPLLTKMRSVIDTPVGSGGGFAQYGTAILSRLIPSVAKAQEDIDNLNKTFDQGFKTDPIATAAAVYDQVAQSAREWGVTAEEAAQHYAGSLEQAQRAMQEFGAETISAKQHVLSIVGAYQQASQAAQNFGNSFEALTSGGAAITAAGAQTTAWREFTTALQAANGQVLGNSQASIAAQNALQQYGQSVNSNIQAMIRNGATLDQVNAAYDRQRQQLVQTLIAQGMTGAAARQLANDFLGIPSEVKTAIRAEGIETAQRQVLSYWQSLQQNPKKMSTVFEALTTNAKARTAEHRRALNEIPKNVRTVLEALTTNADARTKRHKDALDAIPDDVETEIIADIQNGTINIDRVKERIKNLDAEAANPKVDVDPGPAVGHINDVHGALDGLSGRRVTTFVDVQVGVSGSGAAYVGGAGAFARGGDGAALFEDEGPLGALGRAFGSSNVVRGGGGGLGIPIDIDVRVNFLGDQALVSKWLDDINEKAEGWEKSVAAAEKKYARIKEVQQAIRSETDNIASGLTTGGAEGAAMIEKAKDKIGKLKGEYIELQRSLLGNKADKMFGENPNHYKAVRAAARQEIADRKEVSKYWQQNKERAAEYAEQVSRLAQQLHTEWKAARDQAFGALTGNLNLGSAFDTASQGIQQASTDLTQVQSELKSAQDEAKRLGEEKAKNLWNPTAVAHYNAELEKNRVLQAQLQAKADGLNATIKAGPSSNAIGEAIAKQVTDVEEFASYLEGLQHLKVPPSMIEQLLAMPPEKGKEVAKALFQDGELRAQYVNSFNRLAEVATPVADTFANDTRAGFTRGAKAAKAETEAYFKKHPIAVDAKLLLDMPDLYDDKLKKRKGVTDIPVGGDINITVNGALDADAVAIQIDKILNGRLNRTGKKSR